MARAVLVIDREVAQRNVLVQSLQNKLGYLTFACDCSKEAVNFFASGNPSRPDLILIDWSAAAEEEDLNLKGLNAHAPVVALVKYGDYDAGIAALNAGAQDFLCKPVAMERISTTFRNMLLLRDVCSEMDRLRSELAHEAPAAASPHRAVLPPFAFLGNDGNMRCMDDIEAEAIRFAMQYYHGRMTEVAKRLGIGRSTLYRKLSELGVREEQAA